LSQFWHFSSDSKKYLAHLPAASHFSNHSRCQNDTEEMQANINEVVYTTQEESSQMRSILKLENCENTAIHTNRTELIQLFKS